MLFEYKNSDIYFSFYLLNLGNISIPVKVAAETIPTGINGFVLGAVDIMLYSNFPNKDEKAIFWYMQFENSDLIQEST
ncbi:MAG: hypothetical protein HPY74_16285 [Firmicutes bacterium]|nr:hypothetical protein [Bacillota bacterium]